MAAGTAVPNREKPSVQSQPPVAALPVTKTSMKRAMPEALDGEGYGKENGGFSLIPGPGKVMSMGSSSYVADMVRFCLFFL